MGFDADIAVSPGGGGRYRGAIAPDWETPRGPLGGYVMALIVRALELELGDPERQPRSLTVYFLRTPAPAPITVTAKVERSGRSLTHMSARMEQDGEVVALALASFSIPWDGPLLSELAMPDVEPPGSRSTPPPRPGDRPTPSFTTHLTMQPRFGDPPFSGSARGEIGGWLGLHEQRPVDAAAIVVLADAWYPAPWPRLKALAPAPTVELTVLFRAPLPLPDSLLLGHFHSRHVEDGFFEEDGVLWAPDGTVVAQSRQLGLLIGAEAESQP